MSTGRLSRPSSAASHSSRLSHASYASHSSRTSHSSSELKLECKAAYLSVFDDIHDPIANKHDFVLVLQQAGRNPAQKVINKYWDDYRDSMSFDEFVDVCRKVSATTEDDLLKAFRRIDINGDGYISLDELYKIMTTRGERLSRQEVKNMIDEVDENKDGRLDYKEFCRMFMSTTEECKKLSLRMMEKKERRRKRKEDGPTAAPRKDKEEGSVSGSQLSVRSAASEKTKPSGLDSTIESKTPLTVAKREESDVLVVDKEARPDEEKEEKEIDEEEERGVEEKETMPSERESVASRSGSRLSMQSQQSLSRITARSGSRQSLLSIDDLPKPSPRGNRKSAVIGRLSEPRGLRDWHHAQSKGCFFVDENKGFVSHQYQLTLTENSAIWLTIQPLRIGDSADRQVMDTAMYILHDEKDDDDALIAFTEQRDSKGCHGVRCDLTAGTYSLIPFTTGCRLRPRHSEPSKQAKLITKDKEDKVVLTKPFKKALEEIFEISDLDGNNLLSREEFNWFNIRTSDEQVADDEWQVVEENVELAAGEVTRRGFITLNEMEAEDNNGDTEDLWITLNNMGFNKALDMDEACPFRVDVYADNGEAMLKVTELENPGKMLENAVCAAAISKGEGSKVKAMKDLTLYTYIGDARATIAVENKSRTKVTLELDCSKSRNCLTSNDDLISTVTVPGHSKKVAVHLLPDDEKDEWSVRCAETILK